MTSEEMAKIIEAQLRSLDLGCGEDVNIADCIAEYRQEDHLRHANELIGDFAVWCADAILAAQTASAPLLAKDAS